MTPAATRLARRLALTLLGLGLQTTPLLFAFESPANALADTGDTAHLPASSPNPVALAPAYALTLQGRTRSLQELFGRPQW